jgi:hypothetical protein
VNTALLRESIIGVNVLVYGQLEKSRHRVFCGVPLGKVPGPDCPTLSRSAAGRSPVRYTARFGSAAFAVDGDHGELHPRTGRLDWLAEGNPSARRNLKRRPDAWPDDVDVERELQLKLKHGESARSSDQGGHPARTKRQASRSLSDGRSSMASAWATRRRFNGSAAMRSIDRAAASLGVVFFRTSGGVRTWS